jgi:MFS transporter, PAT family, beta-lactamase induction signal transducer AmpG
MSASRHPNDPPTPVLVQTDTAPATTTWREALRSYLQPASLRMFALGFAAGLPLLLVLGTLSFRLREAGLDRATIGYLSWVGLAYGFKWCWAPLVDRLPLPWLSRACGQRRAWLLLSQVLIMGGLLGMGSTDPRTDLSTLVGYALLVAFASATQDIALDAFRIESAAARQQGVLAASYQTGYRLAMIWAGAGVLWLAARAEQTGTVLSTYQQSAWQMAYWVMATTMLVGVLTVCLSPEPTPTHKTSVARTLPVWLREVLLEPFADFFQRYGRRALLILALIGVYRISDVVMGIMANPFYVDMGYTKDEVAAVTKVYGVIMTLVGAFLGGAMAVRWGVARILMLGALLSACSNVLFAGLAGHGHDVVALIAVVAADNLSGGIASAAFVAYLSSLTNVTYSATQYALFSSMMLLAPKWLAGFSGAFVDSYGYSVFFVGTAALGVPVLGLVWLATRAERST